MIMIVLGFCFVAKTLFKKDFEFAFFLRLFLAFFSCVDSSNVTAKSKQLKLFFLLLGLQLGFTQHMNFVCL